MQVSPYYSKIDRWQASLIDFCNVGILNAHFNRYKTIKASPWRWFGFYLGFWNVLSAVLISRFQRFQSFRCVHQIQPYLKSVLEDAWEKESEWLDKSCSYKFRNDISLSQCFFRYWQLARNLFYPYRHKDFFVCHINDSTSFNQLDQALRDRSVKTLCLNDTPMLSDEGFQRLQPQIVSAFELKLKEKSAFEK